MTVAAPIDRITRARLQCMLYVACASMHLNRQIVAILAGSLRRDLGLGDAELGALTGSAFAIVFAVLGLHFDRIADRCDRLAMVRCRAWLWSGAACAAALAIGFPRVLLARATVAIGEAVATAAAISLMADLSSDRGLGRASGVFFASTYAGAGFAMVLGGALLSGYPSLARIAGWRAVMLAAAVPSFGIALLLRNAGDGGGRPQSQRHPPARSECLGRDLRAA